MTVKTPTFQLTIGSVDFPASRHNLVHSIEVVRVSNGSSLFTIKLLDDNLRFSNASNPQIKEGVSCQISLGFVEDGTAKVIEGIVTSVQHKKGYLIVSGDDYLHYLKRGGKRNSWESVSHGDIVSIIASNCGLEPDCCGDESQMVLPYISQNNETNLAFLLERGKRIGYHTRAEGKRLIFQKPRRTAEPSYHLTTDAQHANGRLIITDYSINPNTANCVQTVVARSYDPATAEPIIARAEMDDSFRMSGSTTSGMAASKNNPDTTKQISCENVYSQEEAQILAQAHLEALADEFIKASVTIEGNGNVAVGTVVALEDIGSEYSGNYYVQEIKHKFVATAAERDLGYKSVLTLSRTGR